MLARSLFRRSKSMRSSLLFPFLTLFLKVNGGVVTTDTRSRSFASANAPPTEFYFKFAAAAIPHPDKVEKGGEDANFVMDQALGVADGVGGWVLSGIDPSLYSRALCKGALDAAKAGERDPVVLMEAGVENAGTTVGSATFVVVSLNGTQLRSGNVGDSGFMVFRNKELIFRSKEQQHDFNFPFQLGTGSTDSPADAATHVLEMQENDIVVLGSDGLFDNVFDEVIASMVKVHPKTTELADRLSKVAAANGADINFMSPFAVNARRFGFRSVGGKLDDVTVVVGKVAKRRRPLEDAEYESVLSDQPGAAFVGVVGGASSTSSSMLADPNQWLALTHDPSWLQNVTMLSAASMFGAVWCCWGHLKSKTKANGSVNKLNRL